MRVSSNLSARYRYSVILLRQLVVTEFKLRYQGSILGYLWSLLKPLALFSILYIVFVRFLRFGSSIENFPVILLLGIVLWNFFTEVTILGIGAIVGRGDLLRKLNFPKYVIIFSVAFSALINLVLNLIVVGVFMALNNVDISAYAVFAPLLILELFVLSIAVAFFLSALYVKFRDISYIWEVVMQAAFYATPIIYPLSIVPAKYAKWLLLNPVAQIIEDLRHILINPQVATISTLFGNGWVRLIPVSITVLIAVVAAWYFRSQSKHFAENI